VNDRPKKLITRILEFAALFALSAFLLRLAACYILSVWPVLVTLAALSAGIAIFWRFWKNRARW
jgi:hypothetical protein